MNKSIVLSAHESDVLMPLVIKILNHRNSKEKVFSNSKIRKLLKEFGENVSDPQVRKLIFYIRNNDLIDLLIANSDGYYVANNVGDVTAWLESQRGRINEMKRTINSIESQFKKKKSKLKDGNSGLVGQLSIFDVVY